MHGRCLFCTFGSIARHPLQLLTTSRRHLIVLLIPLFLMLSDCAEDATPTGTAQEPKKGAIIGTVVGGTDKPVAGGTLTTGPGGLQGISDSSGNYFIADVPGGIYTLRASKEGSSSSGSFLVNAGDTTRANIRLPTWQLAWSDEFDGTTLDTTKWVLYTGTAGMPDELQCYAASDLLFDSGHLLLRSQKRDTAGFHYT